MKIAIVHDFLMQMGGAEKVVDVLHAMFPQPPIFTSAYDPDGMPSYYRSWDIRTSFLQRLWMKNRTHRYALLLYPLAFKSFNLREFDLVISSSSAFAKGVLTQPHTTHVSYTHAPMRYAWTTDSYAENERLSRLFRAILFLQRTIFACGTALLQLALTAISPTPMPSQNASKNTIVGTARRFFRPLIPVASRYRRKCLTTILSSPDSFHTSDWIWRSRHLPD